MDKLQWGKRKRLRCVKQGEEKGGERMDKLQWGKRKRLRCVKLVKDSSVLGEKSAAAGVGDGAVRKEITTLVGSAAADANRQTNLPLLQSPPRLGRDLGEDEQIKFERQHESGNNSVVTGDILSNSGGQ